MSSRRRFATTPCVCELSFGGNNQRFVRKAMCQRTACACITREASIAPLFRHPPLPRFLLPLLSVIPSTPSTAHGQHFACNPGRSNHGLALLPPTRFDISSPRRSGEKAYQLPMFPPRTPLSLIGNTVRNFPSHVQLSAAQGSPTRVSA